MSSRALRPKRFVCSDSENWSTFLIIIFLLFLIFLQKVSNKKLTFFASSMPLTSLCFSTTTTTIAARRINGTSDKKTSVKLITVEKVHFQRTESNKRSTVDANRITIIFIVRARQREKKEKKSLIGFRRRARIMKIKACNLPSRRVYGKTFLAVFPFAWRAHLRFT